jgi:hypothetical protein
MTIFYFTFIQVYSFTAGIRREEGAFHRYKYSTLVFVVKQW